MSYVRRVLVTSTALIATFAAVGPVLAQAAGPLASGLLRDASGNYTGSLILFGSLAALAAIIALVARHPRPAAA